MDRHIVIIPGNCYDIKSLHTLGRAWTDNGTIQLDSSLPETLYLFKQVMIYFIPGLHGNCLAGCEVYSAL